MHPGCILGLNPIHMVSEIFNVFLEVRGDNPENIPSPEIIPPP